MNFFSKKSHNAEKSERGDPLVSPGIVCCAEKQKTFLVQFAKPNVSICFKCFVELSRTILVSSCGLKKVTIIVAFRFMKRRLKMEVL